jgi:hypothetical protein
VPLMDHQRRKDLVEARDAAVVEGAREAVVEGGEVAPHGQHDAAAGAKVGGEVPGASVECVGTRVGQEQAARETPEAELVVRCGGGWVTRWSPGGRAGVGATPQGGCKVRMARGGVNSLIKTSTRIT